MNWKVLIPIIISFSIISVTGISYTACDFQRKSIYPQNSSGIFLADYNKTIYIHDTIPEAGTWVSICEGEVKKESFNLYGENCTRDLFSRGVPKRDVLIRGEIQLNTKDVDVTEKGFFCFGRKVRILWLN